MLNNLQAEKQPFTAFFIQQIAARNISPAAKVAIVNLASTAFPVEAEDVAALVDGEAVVGGFADFVRGPTGGGVLSSADKSFTVGFGTKSKSLFCHWDGFKCMRDADMGK